MNMLEPLISPVVRAISTNTHKLDSALFFVFTAGVSLPIAFLCHQAEIS
jgi:hypothetical protein